MSDLPPSHPGLALQPGRNCWRAVHADRFRLLIDADEYFRAVRQAIANASESVFIVGWNVDSSLTWPRQATGDGLPARCADFLHAVAAARPALRIYVLAWDFSMLYAMDREWRPVYELGWRRHRRIVVGLDGRHPPGASQHQKIVVVDDRLAFVGGIDLASACWDEPAHLADDPRRRDPDGHPLPPVHNVQAMFDGAAARAVGRLARERWRRATGRLVHRRRRPSAAGDPWPAAWGPDVADVKLGIARTEPAHASRNGVAEILQAHDDAFGAARHTIYIESQYFTSAAAGAALAGRLAGAEPPETVVVSRDAGSGWLEHGHVALLRTRLHARLAAAGGDRYRLCCVRLPGQPAALDIHSKLAIVDDDWLCVGSANLSNRSLALDTECSVILAAEGDPRVRAAIAGMRNRLLAEHLGCDADAVARATRGGLLAGIDVLSGGERTLVSFEPPAGADGVVPGAESEPEKPLAPDELVRRFVPAEHRRPARLRYAALALVLLLIASTALLWRWTPLGDYLDVGVLARTVRRFSQQPITPLVVMGGYVAAGLLSIPITILIVVTGVVFGAFKGGLYALAGTLASAAVTYAIGRWLGRETVRRLAGRRINDLSRRLARRGLVAMVILRLLPVAPFTIVNIIAGASQISVRDYLLGTLIGMGPGIVVTVLFAHNLASAMRNPSPGAFGVVALVAVALIGISVGLQRLFVARDKVPGHG
ncbi:VTT domain-containing protein [Pigmentiphaga soli]|uniref:VTT domain-containing protein n=1 Tax=Pigmentiphaga soli TaxID=1007095 RepID=A0ABP8H670_9BURK